MPTDEERREVAARLRAYLGTPAPWHLADVVSDVLGDDGDYNKIQRLADLIDPDGADPSPRDLARAWGWK